MTHIYKRRDSYVRETRGGGGGGGGGGGWGGGGDAC